MALAKRIAALRTRMPATEWDEQKGLQNHALGQSPTYWPPREPVYYFQGNCHYQEGIIHPTFRLNNLSLSYADILLHGQRSTITKKAGEAQWLGWYFCMTSMCYANWTIALITDTLTNLDQSNVTTIITLPRALFLVPVISVCSAWSHFSLRTTWSRGACHALFTCSTVSAVAAW